MTEQADFWASDFGSDYIDRNSSSKLLSSNIHLFANVLSNVSALPQSIFEFGCNIGLNLDALRLLVPGATTSGIDVNVKAAEIAKSKGHEVSRTSIEDFSHSNQYEFVMTKGVLIHLDPSSLLETYGKIAQLSSMNVFICEYFSDTPKEVEYRGHRGKLFKRDFALEFSRAGGSDFRKVAEGFASKSSLFPQDDMTWALFERVSDS